MRKVIYALVVIVGLVGMARAEIVHPGCLSTQADLDRMAAKVAANEQPWKGSWDILVGNEGWYMIGPYAVDTVYVDSPNHWSTYMVLANDSHRAYQAALRYHGTGDTNYAEHAIAIMNAWASTHTAWDGNSNVFLRMGLYGHAFACAGELMRNYSGWDPVDFAAFQQYMRTQYYEGNSWWLDAQSNSHYWANWTLANLNSMLAIGVLCDDQSIIDEALNHFYNAVHTGCIENSVYYVHPNGLGQWQESGRDQGHAQMGPQLIGSICEIAWNQGYDLYGYMNNRVLAGVEYISKYNTSHAVPFAAYANSDYAIWPNVYHFVFKGVAGAPSGGGRPGWDLIYNHYVNRMGMAAPYTEKYAEATRPEGGGRNYGSNSGGFDGLGFTTLTHSRDPIADIAPSTLRPVVQGRQITLSWAGSAHATSYNVKRSTTSGGPYTTLATVDGDSLFYVDPGLTVGTTYYYVVSANNPGGESADSAEATATTDTQLFGTVIGSDFSAGWHGATKEILFDGSLGNFIDLGGSGGGWAGLDLGSGVSAEITGVKYCPRAGRPNDMVGGKFQASNTADFSSGVVDLYTITAAPPEGVLTFQAVNSGSAYRYVRYIQPDNGEWNTAAEVQFLGNVSGQSAPSTPVVEGTLVNGLQINLSLDGLSGIPGSTGYRIKRSTTSGGPYLVYGDVNPGYGNTTVFSDVETETNTTYYYVVSTYNQIGESADTAELSFSTLSTAPQLRTHLKMSGNVADSSDNNFQAGTVGSPDFPGGGYVGSSIDLDGVDDYVWLNNGLADSDDITVAAWVNWDGGADWQRIFDFGAGTESYLYLTPSGNGKLRFGINDGGEQFVETASALPTGTWTHVAVTLSGDTATIYVNGSPVASSSSITINPSDFDHWSSFIGKSQWGTDPLFDGRIDDFRVYNYALSAVDVAALAAEASDMTPPAAPAGLGATIGDGTVDLDWADNGESDFASYTVYRSTTSGSGYSAIATGLTTNTYTDNTVANGTTYFYVVTATDTSGGESADSAEASGAPEGAALVRFELEGNAIDSSGNGHDATATGSPAYVAGWTGQAIDLDGTDDYLTIPSGVVSDVEYMTIAAWVNWDGGGDWQRIFDFGDGTGRYMFLSPSAGGGKLRFAINNGGGEKIAETTVLETGTWVHVAVTLSNWTTKLYVNGVVVAINIDSINPTGFDFMPANNYIGKSQFGSDPLFNGRIDDFRIYGYALSDTAVADLAIGAPPDTRAPAAPADLVATASDGIVDLDWADNIEIDLASYTVYRSTTSGSGYTGIASGLTNSAYTDNAVTNGVSYYYVVTATDTLSNESAFSVEVSASPSDLELDLKFDETGGTTAVDSSFRGNNATLVNSPAFFGGRVGNALVLDAASSQHATLPSGIVGGLNDFTVSTWIKVNAFATWQRIFDFGTGTDNYMFLTAQGPAGAGRLRFGILNSGDEQTVDSSVALSTGVWTHVALTRSGDTVSIYIDGSLAGSGTITINPSDLGTTTQNYLGKSQWADPYLDASLDDFRIYNRALSAGEIALFQPQLDAPTGLAATPSEGQVQLTWNAVANAASYKVLRSLTLGGPYTSLQDNVAATSYTDNAVNSSTTYYYVVSAVDTESNESANSAESSATTPADTTPPAAPSDLGASPGDGRVTLDWADNSEPDLDSYTVYRSTTSGSGYSMITSGLGSSAYADTNMINGMTYYYVVTATDTNSNESTFSSEVSGIKGIVSQVTLPNADFDSSTSENYPDGFDSTSKYDVPGWMDLYSPNDCGIENVAWWETYDNYSAFMSTSDGAYLLSSHLIQEGDVFKVSFVGKSWDGASEWTATLFYGNDPTANTIGTFVQSLNGTWTLYTDTAGIVATSNSVGQTLGISFDNTGSGFANLDEVAISVVSPTELDITPPAAPTGLAATPGDGSVALDWNDNTEGDLDGYTVSRSTTNGSGYVSIAPGLTNSAYLDSSVVNGTKYYYVVTASNAGGTSTNSAQVSAQPVSSAPADLSFNLGNGQFEFSWPADHTGWRLQTSTNLLEANWQDVSGAESTNFISVAPTNGNTYYFRLIYP